MRRYNKLLSLVISVSLLFGFASLSGASRSAMPSPRHRVPFSDTARRVPASQSCVTISPPLVVPSSPPRTQLFCARRSDSRLVEFFTCARLRMAPG